MDLTFFVEFFKHPGMLGSAIPSSRFFAGRVVEEAGVSSADSIVEIGPGSGVFTRQILERKRPDAAFIAIEVNRRLAGELSRKFPGLTVYGNSAARISDCLEHAGMTEADCIVSGLPWKLFPDGKTARLLDGIRDALADGGTFVTIAYPRLSADDPFLALLSDRFSDVRLTDMVVLNVPPAYAYVCKK